jgi:hypothetical protein
MIDTASVGKTKRGSNVPKDRVVKQTGLADEDVDKLKHYAIDKKMEIQELTDLAIMEFFAERDEKLKRKEQPEYNLSPKDAEPFSVRLSPSIAAKVEKVAEADQATGRRLIYTGLRRFIKKHGL